MDDYQSSFSGKEIDELLQKIKNNGVSVKSYGAKGDGTTDDTAAFQTALTENRLVYVPEGTYKLSGTIEIGDNCELELAQSAVLDFTQTTGNCIVLNMVSSLKGNHATVKVPYMFEGNVLYAYSADTTTEEQRAVEPWTKWDPQWKSGRYVTDLNICKADPRGFHYPSSVDACRGTAVYISAKGGTGYLTYMWGLHYSGLRIAGSFSYGIRAVNTDDGWLHEMRVEAFIQACEIGVSLEDCNNAYVSAIIQPSTALLPDGETYKPYAKQGIRLIRSKNVDLSGSRVWDWNEASTLLSENLENQHLALYGNCRGLILNDFYYYETTEDIREQIYTDTPSNLEQITILQEPITRWFKPVDGTPYFSDGLNEKPLLLREEFNSCFVTDKVPLYNENALLKAIDTDGSIYNGTGYKISGRLDGSGQITTDDVYNIYTHTGYIKCKKDDVIHVKGIDLATNDSNCRIAKYDSNFNFIQSTDISMENILKNASYYHYTSKFNEVNNEYKITLIRSPTTEYIRISVFTNTVGTNPIITVNEEIGYEEHGFLAPEIKVKAESVIGLPGDGIGNEDEKEVEIITGNFDFATLTMSNLSHTYQQILEAIDGNKNVVMRSETPVGPSFATLAYVDRTISMVAFNLLSYLNVGQGIKLYYFRVAVNPNDNVAVTPLVISTLS